MDDNFDPLTSLMAPPAPRPPSPHVFTREQVAPEREAWVRLTYPTSPDFRPALYDGAVHEGVWREDGRLDLNTAALNYDLPWSPPLLARGSYDLTGPLPGGWRLWVDEPVPAHLAEFARERGITLS